PGVEALRNPIGIKLSEKRLVFGSPQRQQGSWFPLLALRAARVLVSLAGAAGCKGLHSPCWRCGLPGSWFPLLALRAAWTECLNLMPMGVKPLATIGRRSAAANTGRAWRDVSQNGNRPAALSRNERATGRKF